MEYLNNGKRVRAVGADLCARPIIVLCWDFQCLIWDMRYEMFDLSNGNRKWN